MPETPQTPTLKEASRDGPRRDLLILLALCSVALLPGLNGHGLTNWQESVRLVAAREMVARHDMVVPTLHDQPYLAKPPLFYWVQIGLARLTGHESPELLHLRLAVAIAAMLGVVFTYLCVRTLLRAAPEDDDPGASNTFAQRAAFWSAASLATGPALVRAGRIGELDIWLIPFTALAVLGGGIAWRAHSERERWAPGWLTLACAGLAGAALTKGPPGVLPALLATLGACLGRPAWERIRAFKIRSGHAAGILFSTLVAGGLILWFRPVESVNDAIGVALLTGFAFVLCLFLAGLFAGGFLRGLVALWRVNLPLLLAASFLPLWLWGRAVEQRIGTERVRQYAAGEAADNLNLLVLEAPLRNLELYAYGAGLGSLTAIIAVIWFAKDRPKVPRGVWPLLCWAVLSLIAFSTLGKGVQRYLLPAIPAVAAVGGLWIAAAIRDLSPKALSRALAVVVAIAAVGQGWWYGYGRDDRYAHRSPRDFMAALLRPEFEVDPERIGSLDLWTPAFDYYAGAQVQPYIDEGVSIDYPHAQPRVETLLPRLRAEGEPYVLLIRGDAPPDRPDLPLAEDRLVAMGFGVELIPVDADFRVDRRRTRLIAVRVWAP
ncbi:MAG: hypothetical protein AAGG07_01735 [Planctomycetota bacterium]